MKASGVNAEVKPAFDQSHSDFTSLDHFLTDECIVYLIQAFWNRGPADKTFYKNNPDYRDYVFTRPYPSIAQIELGYPANETDQEQPNHGKDDDDEDEVQEVPNPNPPPPVLNIDEGASGSE